MINLCHEFNFFNHFGELHGSCGDAKGQGCELDSLILAMKPATPS